MSKPLSNSTQMGTHASKWGLVTLGVLLCTPTIVGTLGLLILYGSAAVSTPTRLRVTMEGIVPLLFTFAEYGPVLLPVAGVVFFRVPRSLGSRAAAIGGFAVLVLGLIAAVFFHTFLTWTIELP